jgi:hypothetical protein
MTKEEIEARIAELEKKLEEIKNNGNAIIGAIQDCKYWIEQITKSNNKE